MIVAVIGIGQSMRGDDAVGVEAVQRWQQIHPGTAGRPDIRVATIEAPSLELLDSLEGAGAAVLVDAVSSGAPPGSLYRIEPEALSTLRDTSPSAHSWGVAHVLHLDSLLHAESCKRCIRLLGVEAAAMEFGEGLSDPVSNALPALCEAIENEVTALLRE